MTTEIVVLNCSAVALAADSIATVSVADESTAKRHQVNKLFTLSKHQPVGVLLYGNSSLLQSTPWETVIKVFRQHLGKASLPTIADYARMFCEFPSSCRNLMMPSEQDQWVVATLESFFRHAAETVDKRFQSVFAKNVQVPTSDVPVIVKEVIAQLLQTLQSKEKRDGLTEDFESRFREQYSLIVIDSMTRAMGKRPIDSECLQMGQEIAVSLFTRQNKFPSYSGIVFAGFGSDEYFPVVHSIRVYGACLGSLIYDFDSQGSFSQAGAAVLPFAQTDVAQSFLFGMDEHDRLMIGQYLSEVFRELPKVIAETMSVGVDDKEKILKSLESATEKAVTGFNDLLITALKQRHTNPLIEVLRFLPKESLAEIAESLVSLTTLKRKVSRGVETVGGPVDVAIISKGDGFVWVRRKHYFDPKLNPTFFANYFER